MLVKSALLTQMSGSVGGFTASHNAGGQYIRARTIPTDPATSQQTVIRSIMNNLTARWLSVATQAQRDGWELYATMVSVLNSLGDPIFLSGMNMFIRTNVPYLQGGGSILFDPPTTFNLNDTGEITFTASGAVNSINLSFDDTSEWANIDDGLLLVYIGRPQNPTINFFKGPYQLADTVDGATVMPPVTPTVMLTPFALEEDQRLWIRVRSVTPDGRSSAVTRVGPVTVGA